MEGGKKKESHSIPPTRPEKRRSLRSPILVMRVKGETENNIFFGYAKNISNRIYPSQGEDHYKM